LGLRDLSGEELTFILDTADGFRGVSTRSVKKVPALRGRVVVNAFFEDSTRTRMSFTLAAQRLDADILDFSSKGSSVSKGETLGDTLRNIEAMGVDVLVLRHRSAGAAKLAADAVGCSIVNAGDGAHEHPTQALLDLYTLRERLGDLAGKHVAIVGDIANSRVARSNVFGLTTLGARVTLVGPTTLVPGSLSALEGVGTSNDLDAVLPEVDAVNMLRVQNERMQSAAFPSTREYASLFGLNAERLAKARDDLVVMHPGPMNRGVEIETSIADGPQSMILRQVTNGLAVRMAVLYLVSQAS
jgi:aspartate carbamoyltransferase catalytic subunit